MRRDALINLADIRYVRLGTRDLEAASRYATSILGLEAAGSEDGVRYFRSDARDHTLAYFDRLNDSTTRTTSGV